MVVKYTPFFCIDDSSCPHIHCEIDISCRYVAQNAPKASSNTCKEVLEKDRQCSAGHDFEQAREAAWAAYSSHQEEAKVLAACRSVRPG
jgi:hypothetical protein